MPNTTDEYWDVDGTSLETLARNIESWGDSRQGVAPLRGGDVYIPFVPGEAWRPKLPGPRIITLAGWVRGTDDSGIPGTDRHATFGDNWRALRNLLWRTDRQVDLTKRWRLGNGTIISATAKAEWAGGLEPSMIGTNAAKFTCDLKLAFPYFRGTPVATGSHSGSFIISNSGDDTTRVITLVFSQAATLTNNTTGQTLTVPAGATLTVETFTTTGAYEGIVNTGNPYEAFWFALVRGNNSLTLSAGTVTITYTPLFQ